VGRDPLPSHHLTELYAGNSTGKPSKAGSFRGLYFATHFGNYFANAPPAKIHVYLEDMALWGANTLVVISEAAKFANFSALLPLLDRNARIGAFAQVSEQQRYIAHGWTEKRGGPRAPPPTASHYNHTHTRARATYYMTYCYYYYDNIILEP
jgi:hypothetical protein